MTVLPYPVPWQTNEPFLTFPTEEKGKNKKTRERERRRRFFFERRRNLRVRGRTRAKSAAAYGTIVGRARSYDVYEYAIVTIE